MGETVVAGSGEAELRALQESPGDHQKAVNLAKVLLARAAMRAFIEAHYDWLTVAWLPAYAPALNPV